ncbi:MAG: hypothetical protein ABUL49_01125 [bacterium]
MAFPLALVLLSQTQQFVPNVAPGHVVLSFAWSKDGKRLAYCDGNIDPKKFDPAKIHPSVVEVDGTNRRTFDPVAFSADFAPDGKSLLLGTAEGKMHTLSLLDLATKAVKRFTDGPADSSGFYSPDGQTIIFNSERGDDLQVYSMNADGTGAHALTQGPGKAYNPMWSMDGKSVVYYRELGDRKDQVYVINADGTGEKHLSDSAAHNFYPAFLADGSVSFTYFVAPSSGTIHIVGMDGRLIRKFPIPTSRLVWSPDGTKAAFIGGGFPASALYVSNADGSNPVKVSE